MTRDEIGKWPVLFPLNKTKGELADIVVKANKDIEYLLSENERLKRDKDLKDYRLGDDYQKATLLIEQLSARVKELEEEKGGMVGIIEKYFFASSGEI